MSIPPKLFLLDAMALVYRAFYAMGKNPRVNSKGMDTGAILGFANTLFDVLKKEKPTHMAVAFDTHAPTHRHEEYSDYKANRQAMPEALALSVPLVKALVRAFNIPVLEMPGYEADDIIGTIAVKAETLGYDVFIMSGDKDFGQLVTEKTKLYRPGRSSGEAEVWGVAEVCARFGISHPAQVIDMLGLWGDASDNIPGIPGIGEVTARKLIERFGSVENLVRDAQQIDNPKLKEKVVLHADQALASKRLATIMLDVPVEFDPEAYFVKGPDEAQLKALLDELEFRAFARRVFQDDDIPRAAGQLNLFDGGGELPSPGSSFRTLQDTPHRYIRTTTPGGYHEILTAAVAAGGFAFDTETTGPDPNTCELVGLSFSVKPGEAWFVPVPANYHEAAVILEHFRELFANPRLLKTGQNLKFDLTVLHWYGIEAVGPFFDTMLAHYLIEPEQRHNMDYLARVFLGYEPVPIEELIGKKGPAQGSMRNVEPEKLKEYAAEDADITLQLKEALEPRLSQAGAQHLFTEIEMPLMPVLVAMETEGVKIDNAALNDISRELEADIRLTEEAIYELAGERFNVASPKQLGVILFEKLRIAENPRLTSTRQYATGEEVLEKLRGRHTIVEKILDYRSLTKLKSTYVDTLPTMVNPRTGRVHTSYNQAVTSTGRLSSNNPNLQNIPVRTERGREIRKAFIPRNPDFILLAADYSQIELRIIAHLSGDEAMQDAFRKGYDIHTATAARIYNLPLEQVDREHRRAAKSVNFGIVYGISAFGLSQNLDIPRREAQQIIDEYFRQYPGIRAYIDKAIAAARENGYVETLRGRRRYLPDIHSANANMRGFAERNAINAPIQGSAADMIKIAMTGIHAAILSKQLRSRMIMQVHDELVFDVYQQEAGEMESIVREIMQNAIPLDVPVVVDINTGRNWLEAH